MSAKKQDPVLEMPFSMEPPLLYPLAVPPIAASDVPALARAWRDARRQGVPAAVWFDHGICSDRPGHFDPAWGRAEMLSDPPRVSPWTPENVKHVVPDLGKLSIRALSPTVWLLETACVDKHGRPSIRCDWDLVFPDLLNDPARTAFWAAIMFPLFIDLPESIVRLEKLRMKSGFGIDTRQTPFGVLSLTVARPSDENVIAAMQWMFKHLPRVLRHLGRGIHPYDRGGEHVLFSVPLMPCRPSRLCMSGSTAVH